MFYTMYNYKRLFVSFLKNNFTEIPSSASETSVQQPKVKDLIKKIGEDKKLDGTDLVQIQELEKKFDADKDNVFKETKEELKNYIKKMLADGYSVKNENDLLVLSNILKLIGPNIMPLYNDVIEKIPKNNKDIFSFVLHGDKLLIYVKQPYMRDITINTDEFGFIDLKTGSLSLDTNIIDFYLSFDDDLDNNNQFTYTSDIVEEEQSIEPVAKVEVPTSSSKKPESKSKLESKQKPVVKQKNEFNFTKSKDSFDLNLQNKLFLVDVKTNLNVRDADGKVIGKMKNGEKVKLTGDVKDVGNTKFAKIDSGNYIALKYLNEKDISKSEEKVSETTDKKEIKPDTKANIQEVEKLNLDLSKGVNIKTEAGYNAFIKATGLNDIPKWSDLPDEIKNLSDKSLSMSFEDGKINIYYGEVRVNNQSSQESYPDLNQNPQKYVMKYGEIVNGKFEKAGFGSRNFQFDDLGNNIDLK